MTTARPQGRRLLLGRAGVLLAALAAGTSGRAEAAERLDDRPDRRPVGSWSVLVTIENVPDIERAHFSFHADGQIVMQTISNSHTGIGSWKAVDGGFVYVLRSLQTDSGGRFVSELRVDHRARFNSDGSYTSTGTGQVVDADGKVLVEVQSTAVGTRFGVIG